MYSNNNTAKEYVLRRVSSSISQDENSSILDFACGTCLIWKSFLEKYPQTNFSGFDFNDDSIKTAKKSFPNFKETIHALDGQKELPFKQQFDIITTFSSLEHVLDKKAFLENIKKLLKSGGIAYLNYDSGHFRSGKITNIYNYISRILATTGITEKYYTKKVSLGEIKMLLEKLDLEILDIKYFNLSELKKIHKEIRDEALLEKWYEYELCLNNYPNKDFLEAKFLSTVIEIKRRG